MLNEPLHAFLCASLECWIRYSAVLVAVGVRELKCEECSFLPRLESTEWRPHTLRMSHHRYSVTECLPDPERGVLDIKDLSEVGRRVTGISGVLHAAGCLLIMISKFYFPCDVCCWPTMMYESSILCLPEATIQWGIVLAWRATSQSKLQSKVFIFLLRGMTHGSQTVWASQKLP